LSPFVGDPIAEFDSIAADRKSMSVRTQLALMRPSVEARYQLYDKERFELSAFAALPSPFTGSEEQKLLRECYVSDSHDTEALSHLKARIRAMQPPGIARRCQYCCGIGCADTWDHYLPKDVFPEFAVYPGNLVPSCSMCNSKRGAWVDLRRRRRTVSLYFDNLDSGRQLVNAKIDFDVSGLPHLVVKPKKKTPKRRRQVDRLFARHFKTLGLTKRFRECAVARLATIQGDIRRWSTDHWTEADIVQELRGLTTSREQQFGANDHETVAYRAAGASRPFVRACMGRSPGPITPLGPTR
jgi:5-methylcytosine-specific restriction endonuclease McrA